MIKGASFSFFVGFFCGWVLTWVGVDLRGCRYTSLGSTFNTFRNPALLISPSCSTTATATATATAGAGAPKPTPPNPIAEEQEDMTGTFTPTSAPDPPPALKRPLDSSTQQERQQEEERYRPAYELTDGELERAGRGKTKPDVNLGLRLDGMGSVNGSSESI